MISIKKLISVNFFLLFFLVIEAKIFAAEIISADSKKRLVRKLVESREIQAEKLRDHFVNNPEIVEQLLENSKTFSATEKQRADQETGRIGASLNMEIICIQPDQISKKQYGMDENGTLTEGEGHVFISGAGDSLTKAEIERMIFYSEMLDNLEDSRMRLFTGESHNQCTYKDCVKALKKKVKSSFKEIADKKMHYRLTDTELADGIISPVFREGSPEENTRALAEIKIWERWYFLDAESQLLAIFKNTLADERSLQNLVHGFLPPLSANDKVCFIFYLNTSKDPCPMCFYKIANIFRNIVARKLNKIFNEWNDSAQISMITFAASREQYEFRFAEADNYLLEQTQKDDLVTFQIKPDLGVAPPVFFRRNLPNTPIENNQHIQSSAPAEHTPSQEACCCSCIIL